MSQESDPYTDVERVDLRSLDVAEQKRQELLLMFPEVRTPDWAILKDDGQARLYLVKETKSTLDFTFSTRILPRRRSSQIERSA
jgi:hypothetical protein